MPDRPTCRPLPGIARLRRATLALALGTTLAMLLTPVAACAGDQPTGRAGPGAGHKQTGGQTLRPGSGHTNRATTRTERHARHAARSPSPAWPALLGAPVLAALLGAGWYGRRRLMKRSREDRRLPAGAAEDARGAFAKAMAP